MEAKQKHCFYLRIGHHGQFNIEPVPLKSVRPLLYKCIELHESKIDPTRSKLVEKYLCDELDKMIDSFYSSLPDDVIPMLPIVRLKIEHGINKYPIIKSPAMMKKYQGRIANTDYLQWYRKQKAGATASRLLQGKKKLAAREQERQGQEYIDKLNEAFGNGRQAAHYEQNSMILQKIHQCPALNPKFKADEDPVAQVAVMDQGFRNRTMNFKNALEDIVTNDQSAKNVLATLSQQEFKETQNKNRNKLFKNKSTFATYSESLMQVDLSDPSDALGTIERNIKAALEGQLITQ